ncbi:hypothetical protein JCM19045_1077 [Bacillus sp. JCM 19045]|nr:hypothetical protein JCM19045_1077 [Bacillus sp. JCM 19045]
MQNNYAFQEGGGFYLRGLVGTPSGFIMRANATITGCISRTSGGGVMIARRNVGDSVTISGSAAIVNNRANKGAGFSLAVMLME